MPARPKKHRDMGCEYHNKNLKNLQSDIFGFNVYISNDISVALGTHSVESLKQELVNIYIFGLLHKFMIRNIDFKQ